MLRIEQVVRDLSANFMQRILTLVILCSPSSIVGGQDLPATVPSKKMQALSLLPEGSELKDVMFPRYDEKRQLVGVLKAQTLTLVSAGKIAGKTVAIEFFNPDNSGKGRIDLKTATFDQDKRFLTAKEPVKIESDRMRADGTGLYYSFDEAEGLLQGPGTTTIQAPPATAMKTKSSTLRATALVGVSLINQPLNAAPPTKISEQDKATLQQDAASKAQDAKTANAATLVTVNRDLEDAKRAAASAQTFIDKVDLPNSPAVPSPASDKPLEINPGSQDTVIDFKGGMYFDSDEGVLVYMKDVTVKDPRFNLSGADELKVFFGKKPPKPEKTPTPDAEKPKNDKSESSSNFGGSIGSKFDDVERIVATGAIVIEQKGADGQAPIKASGALFSYNVKADKIIIKGGFPWFVQGANFMRAMEPNLTLQLSPKTGSLVTEGNWQMGGNLQQKK